MLRSLVGSEMCIRDRSRAPHGKNGNQHHTTPTPNIKMNFPTFFNSPVSSLSSTHRTTSCRRKELAHQDPHPSQYNPTTTRNANARPNLPRQMLHHT
eukprot:TRINITY_DN3241_c0_g1_i2.p1 TRINITY_DN3241_c0_g1~~TRINITY_DN3241_c0_g1_i2.p1  ORF type:complete len:113 (-),score=45.46 TRINITY_DN3241_c0_g1_i2:462-752(-)